MHLNLRVFIDYFLPFGTNRRELVALFAKSVIRFIDGLKNFYFYLPYFVEDYLLRKADRRMRILSIADGFNSSVELAAQIPLDYLSENKKIRHILKMEYAVFDYELRFADIVYFFRTVSSNSVLLMDKATGYNKKIVYGIDDDFEALDEKHSFKIYLNKNGLINNYVRFLKESDSVIVFSEYFQRKLMAYNKNVLYVSNLSNIDLINDLSSNIRLKKSLKTRLGYLGSHPAHSKYLALIKPALKRVLEEFKDAVIFILIGVKDAELEKYDNVSILPIIRPIDNFYKYMMENKWDIGLAPIIDDEHERSKTDNKYREYAALGIAGIYSNCGPFASSVKNDLTGLLADNNSQEDWYLAIKELILDKNKRENIITHAKEDVSRRYNIKIYTDNYLKIFNSLK